MNTPKLTVRTSGEPSAGGGGYDFFNLDPASVNDPWTFWDWVRAQSPAWQDPSTQVYLVTGYADVAAIVRDNRRFSSAVVTTGHTARFPGMLEGAGQALADLINGWRNPNWMLPFLSYDPPVHDRFRRLIGPLFTPMHLESMRQFVIEESEALIDAFVGRGECDFAAEYSNILPVRVVSKLFGVEDEFREMVAERAEVNQAAIQSGVRPGIGGPGYDIGENAKLHFGSGADRFAEFLRDRRVSPRKDILTSIAQARFHDTGEQPSIEELVPVVQQVFAAGIGTTALVFRSAMRLLATNSKLADRLRADPALVPNFVEEVLRCFSSAKGLFRLTLVEVQVGDVVIPPRSIVYLAFQAANRDPDVFADPHNFDVSRPNSRNHLGFGGAGPHGCIGLHVARMELRIGVEQMLRRLQNIRLAPNGKAARQQISFILYGPDACDLIFEAQDVPEIAEQGGEAAFVS